MILLETRTYIYIMFATSLREISRLGSDFISLRWFGLAYQC